jgi:hypothetical protein
MPSYSKYPFAIDDSTSLPLSTDLVTEVKAEVVNRLRDSILKIQNELGINPSAEYGTVKDRLDTLRLRIDSVVTLQNNYDVLDGYVSSIQETLILLEEDINDILTTLTSIQNSISDFETRIYSDNFLLFNCDSSLQVGDLVTQSGGDTVVLADATDENLLAFGIIVEKPTSTTARIQITGEISLSGLTPGALYYASETPGELTSTAPTTSGSFIQFLGFAKSSSIFVMQLATSVIFL